MKDRVREVCGGDGFIQASPAPAAAPDIPSKGYAVETATEGIPAPSATSGGPLRVEEVCL